MLHVRLRSGSLLVPLRRPLRVVARVRCGPVGSLGRPGSFGLLDRARLFGRGDRGRPPLLLPLIHRRTVGPAPARGASRDGGGGSRLPDVTGAGLPRRRRAQPSGRRFSLTSHQSPPARWWHGRAGGGGIRVLFEGAGSGSRAPATGPAPATAPASSLPHPGPPRAPRTAPASRPAPLSVGYGRMDRMSGHRDGTAPDPSRGDGPPPEGARPAPELPDYAERVLGVAERIPPGHVLTYGDIAARLAAEDRDGRGSGGPRQVGRAMALYGGAVPWWRVVRADGAPLPGSEHRALAHYRAEGTPLRTAADGSATRLDMRRARWDGPLDPADDCEVSDTGSGARHV
ncbi:hypothetical protein FNZ23_21320, partial [Streptomyces benahoarensis]